MGLRAVQRLAVPRQAGVVVMLRFQWDSLRRGDLVLVRDVAVPDADVTDLADTAPAVPVPVDDEGDGWDGHDLRQAG